MSCYIPYKDLESTLYAAYQHDFNKYKNLSAVIESVMGLSIEPEAKIHAIWYYSGFINTAANTIAELQTPEWNKGVYSQINNYLQPYLTGELEFDYDSIIKKVSGFFATPIEAEEIGVEDSILSNIQDISTIDESELANTVSAIVNSIVSNRSTLDPVVLDPSQTTVKTLLELLDQAVRNRTTTPSTITALNMISNAVNALDNQQEQSVEYIPMRDADGIGIAQGSQVYVYRRVDGSKIEAVYDKQNARWLHYNPDAIEHLTPIAKQTGDQIYPVYQKDNASFVDPTTLALRIHGDEVLTGLIMQDRYNTGFDITVQDEIANEMAIGQSFYSSIKIKATNYTQAFNSKRLIRIQETFPGIARTIETKERPKQSQALGYGEGPILTYIRPTEGFTITISNFRGDKSFDLDAFADLAFVYPDNRVVKVDFDNPDHIELLKATVTSDLNTKDYRPNISDPIYTSLTDANIEQFKLSVERYRKFSEEVQNRIAQETRPDGVVDIDIRNIFFKYYDITNNVVETRFIPGGKPTVGLDSFIEQNNGELPVAVQTYDEQGNPVGDPVREKIPLVLRKNKGVWEITTPIESNKRLVGKNGKQYNTLEQYLTESEGFNIREELLKNSKAANLTAAFISFRPVGQQLRFTIIPIVYQKQAQNVQDIVDIVSTMQQSFNAASFQEGNTAMIDFNEQSWGFDVSREGIKPQVSLLQVTKSGEKVFGIEYEMLPKPTNTEEERTRFNKYAKSSLNFAFNSTAINNLFDVMNRIYQQTGVSVPVDADVRLTSNLAKEAIQKLGIDHPLVQELKEAYNVFHKDVYSRFTRSVAKHDLDLDQGKISTPLISDTFRTYGLFDRVGDANSLKLYKRSAKENFLDSYKKVEAEETKKLHLTYRDPSKQIRIPASKASARKIDLVDTIAPVVTVPEAPVADPSTVTTTDEVFDPSAIPTDNNIPFSVQQSLEGFFALSDENLSAEIAAMKALLPGAFEFIRRKEFQGLDVDGHVLGMVQNMMIYINDTIKAKGVAYHEGFHAVFRYLLDNNQQKFYLQQARNVLGTYKTDEKGKYITVSGKKVYADEFRRQRGYIHLTDEQIQNLIYEEYLADSFAEYMETNKVPKTWMQKLFAFFKKLLNYFKKGGRIDNLFYDISTGKFRNATIQESKSNVEAVYSLAYRGLPVFRQSDIAGKPPTKNNQVVQSSVVAELRDKMVMQMAMLKSAHPGISEEELFELAKDVVTKDYDIKELISQRPEQAEEIKQAYKSNYDSALWLLGGLYDGTSSFNYINLTSNVNYSAAIDPTKDIEQVSINKAESDKFKQEVIKDFNTLHIEETTEEVEDTLNDELVEDKEEEIGESFKDVSFAGVPPGEGDSAFRLLFKYIPYQYIDPRFGITRTKMVDSKLIFSTIRKVTADTTKENIIPRLIAERDRLDAQIDYYRTTLQGKMDNPTRIPDDFAKMIDLRDSLNAVLDTLGKVTDMDSDGNTFKNEHVRIQFQDVFNTVNVKLMQIEQTTETKFVDEAKETTQLYNFDDIVIGNDISKVRADLKERLNSLNITSEEAAPSLNTLKEIAVIFSNPQLIKDKFFTESGQINDAKLRDYIDNVYIALSKFNLNIPYDAISAILAYNIYVLNNRAASIFTQNSDFRVLLRSNRDLFKDFDLLSKDPTRLYSFFSDAIPNVISSSFNLTVKDRVNSQEYDTRVRRVTTPYINALGEFILKYDSTIAGSVTRNANGDKVHKYVKPTPAYQTVINLHAAEDIEQGWNELVDNVFTDFREYFQYNPFLSFNDQNAAANRIFLEQFSAYAFAGYGQKFKQGVNVTPGKTTTFGTIDDRSYMLSMFGMFSENNRRKVTIPGTNQSITLFPRILTQYEATSTSIVVDGRYIPFINEQGKMITTKSGQPLVVQYLLRGMMQEFDLINKNFKQHRENSAPKLYQGYNINPETDRGFTFNILGDFFKVGQDPAESTSENDGIRSRLKDELILEAKAGTDASALFTKRPELIEALEVQLKAYATEQYLEFRNMVVGLGIEGQDLPSGTETEPFLRDFFYNTWINGIFINQVFDGPIAVGVKNTTDYFKRQKAGAAAGSNLYVPGYGKTYRAGVIPKVFGYIDENNLSAPVQLTPHVGDNVQNKKVEIFDGQTVNHIDRLYRVHRAKGKLDGEAYMYLHRMRFVTQSDDLYRKGIEELAKRGIVFNSLKTVSAAGFQYIKQSEHTLIRKDVSRLRSGIDRQQANFDLDLLYTEAEYYASQLAIGNEGLAFDEQAAVGEQQEVTYAEMYKRVMMRAHSYFEAIPERAMLHNMLNSMELSRVEQLMDTTSSKRATVKPVEVNIAEAAADGFYFDLDSAIEDVPLDMTYVQVETGKVATVVTQGIQQKLLAIAQLRADDPEYDAIKKDIDRYQKGLADAVIAQTEWMKRLLNTSDKNVVGTLYTNIANGLRDQGADTTMLQYFELNPDGTPKFNPNLAVVSGAIMYYYYSLFNKGIFDKKIAGRKFYHVSPFGYQITVDGKTRYPSVIEENDRMVVEVLVPRELQAMDQKFLEDYIAKKLFSGTRIPTEDKRSMFVAKIVGYLDEAYGASIVVPYQVHMLAGSDFDIDALYAHYYASYVTADKVRVPYGDYTHYKEQYGMNQQEAEFLEYLAYLSKNDLVKPLIDNELDKIEKQAGYKAEQAERFGSYFGGKIKEYFTRNADLLAAYEWYRDETGAFKQREVFTPEKKEAIQNFKRLIATFNILQTLQNANLPTTPQALSDYTAETGVSPVVDLVFNQVLESKINILSNKTVFEKFYADKKNRADAAADVYKQLVVRRGLDETQIYKKQNLYTPTALVVARALNAEAKTSLGIAASFNKGVSMLNTVQAKLSAPIGYMYVNDNKLELASIVDDGTQKVGGSIGMFADSPKNPYAGPLNLNRITAPVMLAMMAIGMPQDAAIMFQSAQPIVDFIKEYSQTYTSSYARSRYDRKKSARQFLSETISALRKEIGDDVLINQGIIVKDKKGNIGYNNTAYKINWTGNISAGPATDLSNLGFSITGKAGTDLPSNVANYIILSEFANYMALGEEISFKITALTDTLKGLNPDPDRTDKLRNTYKEVKTSSLFTKDSIKKLFETYPVLGASEQALTYMDDMAKLVFLEKTSFMKGLTSLFANVWGYSTPEIRKDIKAFIQLQLQRAIMDQNPTGVMPDIYKSQLDPENFINGDVISYWLDLRNRYPDNTFLNALKTVTEGVGVNKAKMLELNTTKLGSAQRDAIFADILNLMGGSPEEKIKIFSIAYHGMIKSGAQRTRGGYFDLLPAFLSLPMSNKLEEFQADLIALDKKVMKIKDLEEKQQTYNKLIQPIMSKYFGDKSLGDVITDAITKTISVNLMEDTSSMYSFLFDLNKLSSKPSTQDVVSFFNDTNPQAAANIIASNGSNKSLQLPVKQKLKQGQYELFTPEGNEVNLDFTTAFSTSTGLDMLKAARLSTSETGVYLPLYKINMYGQMLVLKEINGKAIGDVFIETLSATMGSDVSNRMQLNGLTAKYEVVAKQGTPKISPLAFSNPEAISIHNMVMGAQQIRSVRLSPLPKSLTLVTLENRAYEIGKTPSSGIVNSGFQRIDGTTVSMGSRRNEYATLRGKVFMNNKEIKDVEKYDRLANILGKSDWEALKADPKFADFIAGTERVFVYDIVTDQVQAPAQPTRGVPTTMTLKEYADKTSARFVETREVLRKDNIEYYNDRVNDLIEGRLKYAIFASEDLKNRQYLPFINKLKENGFEPVKGMEYILSKGGVNPKDEYTKLMTQPTTSIKPGVQELFDSNPELADEVYEALGFFKSKQQKTETPEEFEKRTGRRMKMWEYMKNMAPDDTEITDKQHQQALQQYSAYLDSIFPDSKVKEILYHMTSDSGKKGIEEKGRFLKPGEVGYQKSDYVTTGGIYFTDNNFYDEETKMYGSPISGAFGSAFISAILNIKNPLIDLTKSFGDISKVDLKGHDGFVGTNESKEIGVLEPDQIHILGSKQDIEGFKKFVGKPTAPVQSTTVSTAQMPSVNDPEVNEIIKQKEEDSKDCNNPT